MSKDYGDTKLRDDKLRELALGATGGVWRTQSYIDMDGVRRTMLIPFSLELPSGMEESDMTYIAAANPDTVLALLDELRRLHAENERLTNELQEARTPNYFWDAEDPERGHESMHNAIIWVLDSRSCSVGDEIKLEQARFLPEITVRITAMEDDDGNGELEYEEIPVAKQPEGQA